jgi:hypothetical protein
VSDRDLPDMGDTEILLAALVIFGFENILPNIGNGMPGTAMVRENYIQGTALWIWVDRDLYPFEGEQDGFLSEHMIFSL